MEAKPMLPAQPPLPTAWNFPFHPDSGSQASISMWESAEGVSTSATRQWPETDSATLTVAFSSFSDRSSAQGSWAKAAPAVIHKANCMAIGRRIIATSYHLIDGMLAPAAGT